MISCPLTSSKVVVCTITVAPPPKTHAVDVSLSRAGRLVARWHRQTHARHVRLRLPGHRPLARGRYTLKVTAVGRHGHRHTTIRRLTVA